jgi:hypothetical protein
MSNRIMAVSLMTLTIYLTIEEDAFFFYSIPVEIKPSKLASGAHTMGVNGAFEPKGQDRLLTNEILTTMAQQNSLAVDISTNF